MIKSLSELFLSRSMKLPLETRNQSFLHDPEEGLSTGDKTVDKTLIDLPTRSVQQLMTGFLVESFRGTRENLREFWRLNREELLKNKFYHDFFNEINRTLEKGLPLVQKVNPTTQDLLTLKKMQDDLVRIFKVLTGTGFYDNPGFKEFFNSIYLLGPALHRYLVKNLHDQAPVTNPWKSFDPAWEV